MKKKAFHVRDVLTVTTGKLLTPVENLYEILGFLTGENLMTHQLVRAAQVAVSHLYRQHPFLEGYQAGPRFHEGSSPEQRVAVIDDWIAHIARRHGENLQLEALPPDAYETMNPLEELIAMKDGTL